MLDDAGVAEGAWQLVKRKGRIRLEVEGRPGFFEFFKRKSVEIRDLSHEWVESAHFEILTEEGPMMVGDWQEVMSKLQLWLAASRD